MFRAINKETNETVYLIEGLMALSSDKIRELCAKKLLVCEKCKEPLIVKLGLVRIPHFAHIRQTEHLPECSLRDLTLEQLYRKQIRGLGVKETRKFEENPEILDFLRREQFDIESYRERQRKRIEPSIVKTPRKYKNNMPPYCLCEICGEKKENWTVVYYDTLIGKCTDCMRD